MIHWYIVATLLVMEVAFRLDLMVVEVINYVASLYSAGVHSGDLACYGGRFSDWI